MKRKQEKMQGKMIKILLELSGKVVEIVPVLRVIILGY